MENKEMEKPEQDRRRSRRLEREEKKQARKLKKEEEFLTNLRKPKDTRLTLIDRDTAARLMGSGNSKFARDFCVDSKDFFKLFPTITGASQKPMKSSKRIGVPSSNKAEKDREVRALSDLQDCNNIKTGQFYEKAEENTAKSGATSLISTNPGAPEKTTKKKNKKKRDPIVLDFNDLLVSEKPEKKRKKVHSTKYRRCRFENVLCGNMLDSSNPKRMKGKHKENKQRKVTKLKRSIVSDRILKTRSAEEENAKVSKAEVQQFLRDLSEKKEAAKKPKNETQSDKASHEEERKKKRKRNRTKYRKYCDNGYDSDLDLSVSSLIEGIVSFQDRAFARDPIKAAAKRRYVVGLREVKKSLTLKKIKLMIVAPDLEAQDSVHNLIEELKMSAATQRVQYAFSLSRRKLGCLTKRGVSVSAIAILNYDGLEDRFSAVLERLKVAREFVKATERDCECPSAQPKS